MARGSKPGERRGGRQKGAPNKASVERQEAIAASGLTPLDYMMSVLRDETADQMVRMDAAKAAAPYVHPKLTSGTMALSGMVNIIASAVDQRL